ncbi:MAG: ATP-binding cassette domain-containing protein [bacterium]|nr:ATP-binding cassette domain-containing protein [bacterium]
MIKVENLNLYYGEKHILKNISFEFSSRWLTIVGESGSGKTTILKSILDILPKNAKKTGSIFIDATEFKEEYRWKKISIVFQDATSLFNPLFKIIDEFKETFKELNLVKLYELLNTMNLEEKLLYSYPHQLSGGQKQRFAVIMATLNQPDYILLDEPTSSVDVITEEIIFDFIKNIKSKILLVTHNLRIAKKYSNEIIVLKDGTIVEKNTTENIFKYPQHEYTKMLLESL